MVAIDPSLNGNLQSTIAHQSLVSLETLVGGQIESDFPRQKLILFCPPYKSDSYSSVFSSEVC